MIKTQDHISDRATWIIIGVFMLLSCFVQITTGQMEAAREGKDFSLALTFLFEASSHFAILPATALIPALLARYPISVENWARRWPIFLFGFFGFTAVHIFVMVGIRTLIYPMLASGPYNFGLLTWEPWLYEMRKDAMTYLTLLTFFLVGRHIGQLRLEAKAVRDEAKDTGRLTLKCGGKIIFLRADEILYASSAANYVEIYTQTGQHLARMTLSSLETLLAQTGGIHTRIHRSYLVNKTAIQTLEPKGDGDAVLTLTNGAILPVSRKYRAFIETAT